MSTGFRDGLRVFAPSPVYRTPSLASLFIAAIAWTAFLFAIVAWAVNIHHFIHKDSLTQLLDTLARIQRAQTRSHPSAASALAAIEKQQKHNLENLHRTCAGVTAFRVKDPDPCAVDNGKILGVRIEVSVKGRFAAPYYLLLNRSSSGSEDLRIHKHTIPPCIPLRGLAAKYLPQQGQLQDLHRLEETTE
ncbi:hypothetical protein SLS58_002080 [Diplodia intermedia]|uniref:Uncharacterized protein n=1 Tax=Diplodia intermedia TaxID=856260 RepID=A0ABR3TZZ5_9PEZI